MVLEVTGGIFADISWHAPYYIYPIALLTIPGVMLSIGKSKNSNSKSDQPRYKSAGNLMKPKQMPLRSRFFVYLNIANMLSMLALIMMRDEY